MHESVKNVKRVWETAKELRKGSRNTKPVGVIQDEFDAWFESGGNEHKTSTDMVQIARTLQTIMDGVVDYEGVFTIAMTNRPSVIPDAVLRRFKYVDVVCQLTDSERIELLKQFLYRGLPISSGVKSQHYEAWGKLLKDAPGDVLGKIADEIHFKFMREYLSNNSKNARGIEKHLHKLSIEGDLTKSEFSFVKRSLGEYRRVGVEEIDKAVNYMLRQPVVQKEIDAARKVYAEAQDVLDGLAMVTDDGPSVGFGAKRKSGMWNNG